ncbi:hypothetical protein SDJN03_05039, partial [Cucurbita argyrosperma subsp. sororia]
MNSHDFSKLLTLVGCFGMDSVVSWTENRVCDWLCEALSACSSKKKKKKKKKKKYNGGDESNGGDAERTWISPFFYGLDLD